MTMLPHIASRIFMRPLLVHPGKLEILLGVLGERIGVDPEFEPTETTLMRNYFMRERKLSPAANRLIESEPGGPIDAYGRRRTMYRIHRGTALIPIIGTLINRGAFFGEDSGSVSYEGLGMQIATAALDPAVRAILLDIDSPGGEANGMTGVADTIRAARQQKPVVALVNDMAASAAYGIAAQANEIVISDTSITGSIGVVMLHMDHSRQLEKRGVKPTFIYAGKHKVDGNPLEPLSDSVRADLQSDVDSYYNAFVKTVAAGRNKLTEESIRATEAKIFVGGEAITHRVADRVGTFAETVAALSSSASSTGYIGGSKMEASTLSFEPRGEKPASTISLTDHQAAVEAARAEGCKDGLQKGAEVGASAAMDRVRAILTSEHAADRLPYAVKFALGKIPADDAIALLAELPVQSKEQKIPPIEERTSGALNGLGNDAPKPQREQINESWDRTFKRLGIATR